jgi:aminoglycoside phosphotransferase (APT) family kinase protein
MSEASGDTMRVAAQVPFSVQNWNGGCARISPASTAWHWTNTWAVNQSDVRVRARKARASCDGAALRQTASSAHAIEREYKVIAALAGLAALVPCAHALCEDESVIGRAFFIMGCVDGRVFWDPSLPGVPAAERGLLYDDMNRVLAALHCVDYRAAGLADFGKTGGYLARQIARWSKQYKSSETERIDAIDR